MLKNRYVNFHDILCFELGASRFYANNRIDNLAQTEAPFSQKLAELSWDNKRIEKPWLAHNL